MKTLLLMRHAKSSWKIKDIPDHERQLNKRGRRDAPRMGALLLERELFPEIILSSSAMRARQTAEIIAESVGFAGEIRYLDSLYMAEAEAYVNTLRELPEDLERVMVIGHNPGLETLLQILSNRIEALPTAVLAHIALPITSWSSLNSDTDGELIEIWRPKELPEDLDDGKKAKGKEKEKEKDKDIEAKEPKEEKEKEEKKDKKKKSKK